MGGEGEEQVWYSEGHVSVSTCVWTRQWVLPKTAAFSPPVCDHCESRTLPQPTVNRYNPSQQSTAITPADGQPLQPQPTANRCNPSQRPTA